MPVRGDPSAPRWDGNASQLADFLYDVKVLSDHNGCSEAQTITAALRYAPSAEARVWRTTDGYEASSWSAFASDVLDLYPDASEGHRSTLHALEAFVTAQSSIAITTPSELAQYHRNFLSASAFLVKQARISTGER
ncbi:hypothetical protein FIBSPDRAFT_755032, partial [Athelia psychrophila]